MEQRSFPVPFHCESPDLAPMNWTEPPPPPGLSQIFLRPPWTGGRAEAHRQCADLTVPSSPPTCFVIFLVNNLHAPKSCSYYWEFVYIYLGIDW